MTTSSEVILTVGLSNGEEVELSYPNAGTISVEELRARCTANSDWASTVVGYTGLTDSAGTAHGTGIKACRIVTTETEVLS